MAGVLGLTIGLTRGTLRGIEAGPYELRSRDLETLLGRPSASHDETLRKKIALMH